MNILVVSQWFPPEPGGGPARFYEMATQWMKDGHDVTVLAGIPNWPSGKVSPSYAGKFFVQEEYRGLRVIRSWVYATPNEGVVKRIVNHMSFMFSAPLAALWARNRPDVVVATSPPLFAAVAGRAIAASLKVPFVFDVRDLWPDAIFALGQMRQPSVRRILRSLERSLYRASALVVAVSPPFERPIKERGARSVEVIPNGADLDFFSPGAPDPELREGWGWEGKFVVLYAGTVGLAHGLETVLDAAGQLSDSPAHFAIVGEGANRKKLEAEAARRKLANVQFLPIQPRDRMPALYRSADICLVSLRPLKLFEAFIPSKVFEIMACGKPIIASVSGQALSLIRDAGAGLAVSPGSDASLVRAVQEAMASEDLEELGTSGRRYVETHFERRALARRYMEMLKAVVSNRLDSQAATK